ncbi:MAG: TadE family protein [Myxococcota bacterium]
MTRRRGTNAIEFSLLMPVFVIAVMALIDLSWLSFRQGAAQDAVQRGCRDASLVDPGRGEADVAALLDAARAAIKAEYDADGCDTCEIDAALTGTVPYRAVECSLEADHFGLTPFFGGARRFGSQATMRLEYQRRSQ